MSYKSKALLTVLICLPIGLFASRNKLQLTLEQYLDAAIQLVEHQEHQNALKILLPLAQQEHNMVVQAHAQTLAGQIYYQQQNAAMATDYLLKAAHQIIHDKARIHAQVLLGKLYIDLAMMQKKPELKSANFKQAAYYLEQAIKQTVYPAGETEALSLLDKIKPTLPDWFLTDLKTI